jgi:hypothetical protein
MAFTRLPVYCVNFSFCRKSYTFRRTKTKKMKKLIIGSLVTAVLLFGWQSLSWTALHIHDDAYIYTTAEDTLINALSSHLPADGQYMVPRSKPGASPAEMEKMGAEMKGKPWAVITYHMVYKNDMTSPIIRGFLIAFVCAVIVCLVIQKLALKNFGNIFATVISFGLISFFFVWYNQHNWFEIPWTVLKGELIDILASWGLAGVWLGWWYPVRS